MRGEFDAWLNALKSGKDIRTHFQSHSKSRANNVDTLPALPMHNSAINSSVECLINTDNSSNGDPSHVLTHVLSPMVTIDFEDIQEEVAY